MAESVRAVTGLMLAALLPGAQAAAACRLVRYAQLPVTLKDQRAYVSATVNGVDASFFADTGAFFSIISTDAAQRMHLRISRLPPGLGPRGVSGPIDASLGVARQFTLHGFGTIKDVEFFVAGNAFAGDSAGIIGQNILGFKDAEFDLAHGVIRLIRAEDCRHDVLAYWQKEGDVAVVPIREVSPAYPHLIGRATLNGTRIGVMFDSGAGRSMLDRRAAHRVGIRLDGPGVLPGGVWSGLNGHGFETWITRFDSLDLGGEVIRNARLRIADVELPDGADMVLGMDFFLSHHLYVANSQHRIYITYNGGPVFDLRAAGENATDPEAPADAEGLRRRAAALAERGELRKALADLDRAVVLQPDEAAGYQQRAAVLERLSDPERAAADLDRALRLRPDDRGFLLDRGVLRLRRGDQAGAKADFDRIMALAPQDMEALLAIARACQEAGQQRESIALLDRWVAANAHDDRLPAVLAARCWARALTGDSPGQAIDDCNAALRGGQRTTFTLDARGVVLLRQGEFDRAIRDFNDALRLQPRDARALYARGLAESSRGLKTAGQQDMQAGAALDPQQPGFFDRIGLTAGK